MKRIILLLTVIAGMLVGCGSEGQWEIEVHSSNQFQEGQPLPLTLEVKEKGTPVTGLKVHALLEMRKMDHGSVEADFKETKEGIYEGMVTLPMAGEWVAIVQMEKDKQSVEKSIAFEIKE